MHEISNSQVRRQWNAVSQSERIATSQLSQASSERRGRKETCSWKAQWRGETSHAALNALQPRFQDLPLEVAVKLRKLRSECWRSTEVAPCWRASLTDWLPAHRAFPAQKAAMPVPGPRSPPAAPILSTACRNVAFLLSWSFTLFTVRSLTSVNVDVKPEQIVASERRQNGCTYYVCFVRKYIIATG